MCDEIPLEHEQPIIDILNDTLQPYLDCNHTSNDIVLVITSYVFCNEYYFRRDCHIIDIINETITLYLYKSKFCINLFKLTCPIRGHDFFDKYISMSAESTPNSTITNNDQHNTEIPHLIKAWIDTECKDDTFSNSKSANMINNSCFLLNLYMEASRQNITPWLAQWKYDSNCMPYIQVICRIISYPSDWNYVTLTYKHNNICAIFYTSQEQHTIHFIPYKNDEIKEKVSIIRFANGLNFPWLMFGSAATKTLTSADILLLFGADHVNNTMHKNCEYFVSRSCVNFSEMRGHGEFWTTSRDHIAIFQITDLDEKKDNESVDFNVQCQFPIFRKQLSKIDNLLDVTITNNWSPKFQCKYNIEYNHKLFMVLYTEIRHDIKTIDLYCAYINVRGGKVEVLVTCKLASSKCLTKFLVGRGSYQTVYNDWMCTLIGIDQHNREIRHQLRISEELELLYYQRVKRNENVQEVTNRYKCKALKYFKRAKKEELAMQKSNQPVTVTQAVWRSIFNSRHLILSTIVGAYIGWRVSKAMRGGQWTKWL